jgi:hypothetical protein
MAIGEAWWDTMRECRVQLERGDVAASRQRLRTLFRCIQAAAEPEVLDLLDAEDRAELQRLARVFKALWRRAQQFWALRN